MQAYIGTKIVIAKPMNRGDYNAYREWPLVGKEDPTEDGYLVEYTDGGTANDTRHAGYISWSPKAVFEGSYIDIGDVSNMLPYQVRMIGEKARLDVDLDKLVQFTTTTTFDALDADEQERMHAQAAAMADYSNVLSERIAVFKE